VEGSATDDSGFTLIELMISLALFALIAVAGLALVDSVLGVQGRTEGRLDRLATLQRAMLVVGSDLEQIARGDLKGGGADVSFTRAAPGVGGPPIGVSYALAGGVLTRSAGGATQALLPGVSALRWRFFDGGWIDRWPAGEGAARAWPRAIEFEVTLAEGAVPQGALRRVIQLPVRPEEGP
jgi:general secretion pathway protein J